MSRRRNRPPGVQVSPPTPRTKLPHVVCVAAPDDTNDPVLPRWALVSSDSDVIDPYWCRRLSRDYDRVLSARPRDSLRRHGNDSVAIIAEFMRTVSLTPTKVVGIIIAANAPSTHIRAKIRCLSCCTVGISVSLLSFGLILWLVAGELRYHFMESQDEYRFLVDTDFNT